MLARTAQLRAVPTDPRKDGPMKARAYRWATTAVVLMVLVEGLSAGKKW